MHGLIKEGKTFLLCLFLFLASVALSICDYMNMDLLFPRETLTFSVLCFSAAVFIVGLIFLLFTSDIESKFLKSLIVILALLCIGITVLDYYDSTVLIDTTSHTFGFFVFCTLNVVLLLITIIALLEQAPEIASVIDDEEREREEQAELAQKAIRDAEQEIKRREREEKRQIEAAKKQRMEDALLKHIRSSVSPAINAACDDLFKKDSKQIDALLDSLQNPPKPELTTDEVENLKKQAEEHQAELAQAQESQAQAAERQSESAQAQESQDPTKDQAAEPQDATDQESAKLQTLSPEELEHQYTLAVLNEWRGKYLSIVSSTLRAKLVAGIFDHLEAVYSIKAGELIHSLDNKLKADSKQVDWVFRNGLLTEDDKSVQKKIHDFLAELESKDSISSEELHKAKYIYSFLKALQSSSNYAAIFKSFGFKNKTISSFIPFINNTSEYDISYSSLKTKFNQVALKNEFETGELSDLTKTIVQLAGCGKRDKIFFAYQGTKVYELSKKLSLVDVIKNKLKNPIEFTTLEDDKLVWKDCTYQSLAALVSESDYQQVPLDNQIGDNYICITHKEIIFSDAAEFNKVVCKNVSSVYPFAEAVLVSTEGERRPNYLIATDYPYLVVNAIQKAITK